MKIVAGFSSLAEAEYLVSRGASEIYCGFSGVNNHRSSGASFDDLGPIHEAIALAHASGAQVFLAANESFHPRAYRAADACLQGLVRRGIDGIIIKDIFFLSHLRRIGLKARFVLSSLAQCFNAEALAFYRQYGISRVVIPQHMAAAEAAPLVRNKFNIAAEVFFLPHSFCTNVDGLCRLHHAMPRLRPLPCKIPLRQGGIRLPRPGAVFQLGALYDFFHMGVAYLKLGRGSSACVEGAVPFDQARALTGLLEGKPMTRAEFIRKAGVVMRRGC